jgi:hypothetical protein
MTMNPQSSVLSLALALAWVGGCRAPDDQIGTATSNADASSTDASSTESESTESTTESTTESEDTSESEDPTDTTDPTLSGFVPEQDVEPIEPACDSFAQDCPEGEKCVPYSTTAGYWDANKCVPVMGDQHAGEPCVYGGIVEATDDCDATSFCWDVDVDGGECAAFCTGNADAPKCPPGAGCLVAGDDNAITLCIYSCDPILQDCDAGLACFWAVQDFQCIFTTEDIPTGSPCDAINDCAAGNICTLAASLPTCDGESCCTRFCDLEQGDLGCAAQPGTACVPFFELGMAFPGYENVGQCVLP